MQKLSRALPGITAADPVPLLTVLDTCGIGPALAAIQLVPPTQVETRDKLDRLRATLYAERLLPTYERAYVGDNRPRIAVETACLYAGGLATDDELLSAHNGAWEAARTAFAAAYDGRISWAVHRAAWAAKAAAEKIIMYKLPYFRKMLTWEL